MVRPATVAIAAIPAAVALLFAAALLGDDTIPFQAAGPYDRLDIEYMRHNVHTISHGVTENAVSVSSEVLTLHDDGSATYTAASTKGASPAVSYSVGTEGVDRLKALVKETGFSSINVKFPVSADAKKYALSTLKINLNGERSQLRWPEQNATDAFIPPVITAVQEELDKIIAMAP